MVNVAEEVKNPQRSMKRGMLTALGIASVIYILVAVGALSVLPSNQLAESSAPLAAVFEAATGSSIPIITIIGVVAITNGILIQIITGSRILYGLGREKWIPKKFAQVSPRTHTPTTATTTVLLLIAIASTLLPLGTLAQITSFILLIVFTMVHISALKLIKTKELSHLRRSIPILGIITNLVVIGLQIASWLNVL